MPGLGVCAESLGRLAVRFFSQKAPQEGVGICCEARGWVPATTVPLWEVSRPRSQLGDVGHIPKPL